MHSGTNSSAQSSFEVRIPDYLAKALKTGTAVTCFLDPAQQSLLRAKSKNFLVYTFGGSVNAERQVAVVSSEELTEAEILREANLSAVEITHKNGQAQLTHRDYLGAVLSLGIKRETIGDIITCTNSAAVICTANMAVYIAEQLHEVKNVSVQCEQKEVKNLCIQAPEVEETKLCVASLRADCILAAALKLSRQSVSELFAAGAVKINHVPSVKTEAQVKQDDLLSVRGYGRVLLGPVCGKSRKDRIFIKIYRYK